MADNEGPFTYSSITTGIADPYLIPGELIAGVVHGSRERCFFTCPCHYAHVVYTTRHRLVCMSCGATHLVLRKPVLTTFQQTIAAEEWDELFGAEGSRRHEPVGADNLCHLGRCTAERGLAPSAGRADLGPSGRGMIFSSWA
jgi:hypothetical protein